MAKASPRSSGPGAAAAPSVLRLRLYVAGDAPNSSLARTNLTTMLGQASADTYELEVVDCLSEPMRALNDGVIVTPTLKKISPEPEQTIVGALTDPARVRAALGLRDKA